MQRIILAAIAVASLALSASAQSLPNQAPFAPGTTSTASGARAKPASHHHHVKHHHKKHHAEHHQSA